MKTQVLFLLLFVVAWSAWASSPPCLSLVSSCKLSSRPLMIHSVGSLAYITTKDFGLLIVDLSDPAAPVEVAHYDSFPWGDMHEKNSFLYIATGGYGVLIYSIADPAAPVLVCTLGEVGSTVSMAIYQNYILAVGSKGLYVYDITDPLHPASVASYPQYRYEGIDVQADYAYLSSLGDLCIMDLSDLEALTCIWSGNLSEWIPQGWFVGGFDAWDSYGVLHGFDLNFFDFHNKLSPLYLGAYPILGPYVFGHKIVDDIAYIASNDGTPPTGYAYSDLYQSHLYAINLADPASPYKAASAIIPYHSQGLIIQDHFIFTIDDKSNLIAYDKTACALDQQWISAAARTPGDKNTHWRTEVMLHNPQEDPVEATLWYYPSGEDLSPLQADLQIQPGQSLYYDDILSSLFGLTESSGYLTMSSAKRIIAGSRTYNDAPEGTYGQYVPAFNRGKALGNAESGQDIVQGVKSQLLGLKQSASFRTNIGLHEILGKETTVQLVFYDGAGNPVLQTQEILPPLGLLQKSLSQYGVSTAEGEPLRLEISLLSGGEVLAYASIIDNASGDAVFVPAELTLLDDAWFPVIARAAGAYDTKWKTEACIYNSMTFDIEIQLTFHSNAGDRQAVVGIASKSLFVTHDLIADFFPDLGGDVFGSLRMYTLHQPSDIFMATARIYNTKPDGATYGQFVPMHTNRHALTVGSEGSLILLANNADYRSNVGFTEILNADTVLTLSLYDANNVLLGRKEYEVKALRNLQISNIFNDLAISGEYSGVRAEISVTSGGAILPYASVVDNRTGDAVFVPIAK